MGLFFLCCFLAFEIVWNSPQPCYTYFCLLIDGHRNTYEEGREGWQK